MAKAYQLSNLKIYCFFVIFRLKRASDSWVILVVMPSKSIEENQEENYISVALEPLRV